MIAMEPVELEHTACLLCGADEGAPLVTTAAQMHPSREGYTFVRCRRCGLIYLDPRPSPRALERYYDASYLPHRGATAWGRFAALAKEGERRTDVARVRWAMKVARLGPDDRVLDVGCGRPTFLEALIRATGAQGTGIDPSDHGWAAEPERWRRAGLDLRTIGAGNGLPPGPFALITMWHALEHDYTPLSTLRRLREVALPGAALLLEVPNHDSLTRRLHGPSWAGYHTPRHSAVYTPATLRAMLERAGWTVEHQEISGTLDPYVLYWLGRQDRKGRALDGSLERSFPGFMAGKMLTLPLAMAQRRISLGVQLAVARKG